MLSYDVQVSNHEMQLVLHIEIMICYFKKVGDNIGRVI